MESHGQAHKQNRHKILQGKHHEQTTGRRATQRNTEKANNYAIEQTVMQKVADRHTRETNT